MNKIKVGNTWRNISVPSARVNGSWRPCKQIWVKSGGVWRRTFDMTEPDPFDGSGTLEKTPGNVPWQQLSGTWTKGSGVVTASDNSNRVAAVDTGTTDVVINIDADDANKSGEGIAFWIQDQLNWWGLKSFYNFFSFTQPSNQFYNHFCNGTVEYQTLTANTRVATFNYTVTYNPSVLTGYNYVTNRDVRRFCCCTNATITVNAFQVNDNCAGSCSFVDFPACTKNQCGTQNRKFCSNTNCPTSGTCPNYPAFTFFNGPFTCTNAPYSCPPSLSSFNTFTGNIGTNCTAYANLTYSCTNQTCNTCTYSPWFTFSGRYFSGQTGNKNCTGPVGTNSVYSWSCTPDSVRLPPNTVNVYQTDLQLIRSQAGSVNVINSQSYGNMGNVYVATSGDTITARAYSSTGQSGTLYGPWVYNAGTVPKGNRHGILISSVPYQQTYSISRFEADL